MHAIEAVGIAKHFGPVRAVDSIDLVVEQADAVGLLGPNGAGKTTTILMLLGVVAPDRGSVRLFDRDVASNRAGALEPVAFGASYLGLPDRLTIRETLEVYADLYGAPRSRALRCAELFGVEHLLRRFPWQLSSGQKTLCSLAHSLVGRPRLLILDEPTAALDPEVAARVRGVLGSLHRDEGVTLLITSHNMADIERLCRRVVFMAHGRIIADASPEAIRSRYGADGLEGAFLSMAAEVRT